MCRGRNMHSFLMRKVWCCMHRNEPCFSSLFAFSSIIIIWMPFVHLSWLLIKEPSCSVSYFCVTLNLVLSYIRQHFVQCLFQIFLQRNFGVSHPWVLYKLTGAPAILGHKFCQGISWGNKWDCFYNLCLLPLDLKLGHCM